LTKWGLCRSSNHGKKKKQLNKLSGKIIHNYTGHTRQERRTYRKTLQGGWQFRRPCKKGGPQERHAGRVGVQERPCKKIGVVGETLQAGKKYRRNPTRREGVQKRHCKKEENNGETLQEKPCSKGGVRKDP
jgi:hypothetical protein